MEWGTYDVKRDKEDFVYRFYSEGPRGRIEKMVRFQPMPNFGRNVFNLAFGDWDEVTGKLNDKAVSNNSDQLKVLNTVAELVLDFINFWPNAIIKIEGSTSARTRLYQMRISSFWQEISREFEIYGKIGPDWISFKKGVNYEAFLIFKKIK